MKGTIMKIRFIGDIHADWAEYYSILNTPGDYDYSIQVGDYGVFPGFTGNFIVNEDGQDVWRYNTQILTENTWIKYPTSFGDNHYFIRGNHDHPRAIKYIQGFLEDGTIFKNSIFCLGGARSIDQHRRTEEVSWWRDEECSSREFEEYIDRYEKIKPDFVVTHDFPESVTEKLFTRYPENVPITRAALQVMFNIHKPKLWIGGHWHRRADANIDGTRFICLGINEYRDIDLSRY